MSDREQEIAAKIAKLRSAARLPSQNPGGSSGDAKKSDASIPQSFNDLPDWKKEEVLLRQMAGAEDFLGTADKKSDAGTDEDGYKPKVGTWGVYPRPENISRAFGGGRKIPLGGEKTDRDDPEVRARDAETAAKLAAYRKGQGIDMALEDAHAGEIEAALERANRCMRGAFQNEAVAALEEVTEWVSPMSARGGRVYLAMALAYEGCGRREKARATYEVLKRSAFPDISAKARQLLAGFEAIEFLKVGGGGDEGIKVADFNLPDVARFSEKRYETAVYTPKEKKSSGESTNKSRDAVVGVLVLLSLIAVPVLLSLK